MLEFQHVPIKFRGLDQKTDEKNVTEGDFVGLENVVMQKTFKLESRSGYTRVNVSTTYAAVGAVAFSDSFAIVRSDGVVALPNVANTTGTGCPLIEFEEPAMLGGFQNPIGYDTAFTPNYAIHAVKNQTRLLPSQTFDIRVKCYSTQTGEGYGTELKYTGANFGGFAKVAATRDTDDVLVAICHTGTAAGWQLDGFYPNLGTTFTVDVTPMNGISNLVPVDIIVQPAASGFDIVVAYLQSGGITFFTYNTASATWGTQYFRGSSVTQFSLNVGGAVNRVCLSFYDNTAKIAYANVITISTGVNLGISTSLSLASAIGCYSITSGDRVTDTPLIVCYNDSTTSAPLLASLNVGTSVDNSCLFLASKLSVLANTTNVYWLAHMLPTIETPLGTDTNPLANGNFVLVVNDVVTFPFGIGSAFPPVWQYGVFVGPGYVTANQYLLPSILFNAAGKFRIASNRITLAKEAGQKVVLSKVFAMRGNYGLSTTLPTVFQFGKIALTNQYGAIAPIEGLGEFDNRMKGIIGSFFSVAGVQTALIGTGTPAIPNGTYLYLITFVTTFMDGTSAEVAQSAPISVTVSAGPKSVEFTFRKNGTYGKLGISQAQSTKMNLYRTLESGSVFYLVDSLSLEDTTYTDNMTDTTLSSAPVYFAQGGVLEGSIAPPAKTFAFVRNRRFVASAEEKDTIYYSTVQTPDNMPRFNEVLRLEVSAVGGEIIGIGELDDKILIFKKYAVYAIFGDGPDEIGGGGYTSPQLISNGIGCISQRSIVSTPDGVMFQSPDGIKICDRGLNISDVGAKVGDYESGLVVTGALSLVDRDQVWFFTRTGRTLVWDRFHQIWSTFTGQDTNAPVLYRGTPYFVRLSDGHLLREDATKYQDNVTSFSLYLESGWITLAGIQGFQRMRKFSWSGALANNASIVMYSDFSTIAEETITVNATTVGGVQWEIKPKVQKCEAKKFKITVANITGKTSFSAFGIEAGAKRGSFKKATSQRSGG